MPRPGGRGGYNENVDVYSAFAARYPFPLDPFQEQAIRAIEAGQSVIVSAPTGAGKTLIAEFAIHLARTTGRRIAYTTPLKALSNQKYGDFCRAFGAGEVGILTGDVKVHPRASILVMTTEILRNMFYGGGLPGLGWVVLDECHYMGDEGRGTVWEEIIVNAPADVALVALSATVANVKEIADWISLVHRPIADRGRAGRARAGDRRRARPRRPPRRPRPLVHRAGGRSRRDDRGAGGAGLAARDLLHLQPPRVRARARRLPRRGPEPAQVRAAVRGRPRHQRRRRREPHDRRVGAQPEHLRGAPPRRRAAPRGHSAERQAADRAALRARPLQGGVRDGDDEPRDPHARPERGAPGADQTQRSRL
ncbi:MAG: DEAD/DEAH box helicase, partial [Candidatus Rokubacteria bacterium]|nr:DEAD/DEAH box helicase [Candidatus Rokubacteria bacterium]